MEISPPSNMKQEGGVKVGADGQIEMDGSVPPGMRAMLEKIQKAKAQRATRGNGDMSLKDAPPHGAPPPPPPAAKKKDVSADEHKAQHKRQSAARRAASKLSSADARRSLQVDTEAGPVLAECDDGQQNVQSPREEVEEWVARADGTFARSDSNA